MRKSERLRYLRIIYGLSQSDISRELNCTRNYLSQLENGKLNFGEEKYKEIVNAIYKIGEIKRKEDIKKVLEEE